MRTSVSSAHHCAHGSGFLDAQCLDHLEHVHDALRLTAFDGVEQSTEHTTPAHCVPGRRGEGRLGAIITVPRCSCRICGALEGGGNNYLSYTHTHKTLCMGEGGNSCVISASGAITNGKPRIPIPPPKLQFSPQLRYHYGSALCYIIQYGTSLNRLSGTPHPHCESLATKRKYL